MKKVNDFMKEIQSSYRDAKVLLDEKTNNIFVVISSGVQLDLLQKESNGKNSEFCKVLGGEYTQSENTAIFSDVKYLAYQVRCENAGNVFTVYFVASDYKGSFEGSKLPKKMVQNAEDFWRLQMIKEEGVAKAQDAEAEFAKTKDEYILKLSQYMTPDQKRDMRGFLDEAVKLLQDNDEDARRGLYFLSNKNMPLKSRRIGLYNLGIRYKDILEVLQSPENSFLVYKYLVTVMKREDVLFTEPTKEEIEVSKANLVQSIVASEPHAEEVAEVACVENISPNTQMDEFLNLGISETIKNLRAAAFSDDKVIDILMMSETIRSSKNWQSLLKMDMLQLLDTDMSKEEIKRFVSAVNCLKKYELI